MLKLVGHRGPVRALAFSPDGTRLATIAGREKRVSLWSLPGGTRELSPGKGAEVQALAFAPDGESLVLASGRYLRRWDLVAGVVEERWRRGANHCWQVAFAPDGSRVVATCYDRHGAADRYRVDVFPADPAAKKTFLVGDYGFPFAMTFSPDGRYLAAGGENGLARLWDATGAAKSFCWECRGAVRALAFSPVAPRVAAATGSALTVYDTATRAPLTKLTVPTGEVRALAFAPDGALLSAGDDGIVRLWDVDTGRERAAFDWQVGAIGVTAFSPDCALAAVGGADGLVVWDVG